MAKETQGWFGNLFLNLILLVLSPFYYLFGAIIALFGDFYWLQDQLIASEFLSPKAYGAAKITFN